MNLQVFYFLYSCYKGSSSVLVYFYGLNRKPCVAGLPIAKITGNQNPLRSQNCPDCILSAAVTDDFFYLSSGPEALGSAGLIQAIKAFSSAYYQ
jgi:hypothetical protein